MQTNFPSLRVIFGELVERRNGAGAGGRTGVGATVAVEFTTAALTEIVKVCELEPVALVPVTV